MRHFKLYVDGLNPRSARAIENLRQVCEEHLPGNHVIEVVDVRENPSALRDHQLIALPALVGDLPPPVRQIVGDLTNIEKLAIRITAS